MSGALRRIAVTVEEPVDGEFHWVLLEHGVEWTTLRRAKHSAPTYAKSMADGLLALQEIVHDLDAGPREEKTQPSAPRASFGFGFGGLK